MPPRIISDNFSKFIAQDFKSFMRIPPSNCLSAYACDEILPTSNHMNEGLVYGISGRRSALPPCLRPPGSALLDMPRLRLLGDS